MISLFRRKPKPESVPEKFTRLLALREELAADTRAIIADLERQNQPALLIANHSHLVDHLIGIAVMLWRRGDDPRAAIGRAHAAHQALIACRDRIDPGHALPMDQIAGITEWDLVHALFWLAGTPEPPVMHVPRLEQERYFACSRFLLLRVTDAPVPAALAQAVAGFQGGDGLVDRDFRDKLALLDGAGDPAELMARIAAHWPQRRTNSFYRTSAPLLAGHDASNDLSVDWQLACIARAKGLPPDPVHGWRW